MNQLTTKFLHHRVECLQFWIMECCPLLNYPHILIQSTLHSLLESKKIHRNIETTSILYHFINFRSSQHNSVRSIRCLLHLKHQWMVQSTHFRPRYSNFKRDFGIFYYIERGITILILSSLNEVDFFNWPNPSSTMTLASTQPLTEMSTSDLPGG
jgi:hypothetical protein